MNVTATHVLVVASLSVNYALTKLNCEANVGKAIRFLSREVEVEVLRSLISENIIPEITIVLGDTPTSTTLSAELATCCEISDVEDYLISFVEHHVITISAVILSVGKHVLLIPFIRSIKASLNSHLQFVERTH